MKAPLILMLFALSASTLAATPTETCRATVQKQIDAVDSRMRDGYKGAEGTRLTERRRKLRAVYAECTKNPNAWKKL